ncbi:response regulator transcription factor [Diplocloster hominis]|uniref:response regulator transcription factor n=1 Tax=Diplocloster hominis TaxID=3079010 RepID=UPI0031BAAD83
MLKVLIVEDEPPVARMLAKLIEQADMGFQIIGIAHNGKEGIRCYKKERPDVVFTDIRMPVMDGFGFLEGIQNQGNNALVVILSGYQEFEYARKAISYRVFDYLLKPISRLKLTELLEKLAIAAEEASREQKEEIFSRLFNVHKIEKIEMEAGNCYVALTCLGSFPLTADEGMFPGALKWSGLQIEDYVQKLLKACRREGSIWQIAGLTSAECVFIYEDKDGCAEGCGCMEEIYQYMKRQTEVPVTMITHKKGIALSSIGAMHMQLHKEIYQQILFGRSMFLIQGEEIRINSADETELNECVQAFCAACGGKDSQEILRWKEEFFTLCGQVPVRQKFLLRCLERMLSYYCDAFRLPMERQNGMELGGVISNHCDFESLKRETDSCMEELALQPEADVQHPVLPKVKEFIEKHYREQLTNEKIAGEFGFATSYLSRIYKECYGISPGNYTVKLKIEEAKRMMKKGNGVLMKEVAARVGYQDPYYFSKVFRKETGMWPTQYLKGEARELK